MMLPLSHILIAVDMSLTKEEDICWDDMPSTRLTVDRLDEAHGIDTHSKIICVSRIVCVRCVGSYTKRSVSCGSTDLWR